MVRYILSLDGGGVRGLATLHFLKELDIYLKEKYNRCINDVFHLYIGTSVGGMIASCLACDKKPDELAEYVDENIDIVFKRKGLAFPWSNKYRSRGIDELIAGIIPDIQMKDINKPFLTTAYNTTLRKPTIFNNQSTGLYSDNSVSLRKVIQATSAAPSYFAPVEIEEGTYYIDGGVICIDPVLHGYTAAFKRWKNEKVMVLSVGTGQCPQKSINPSNHWGIINWLWYGKLVDIILGASDELGREQMDMIIGKDYLRINSKLERNIPMDSTNEFDLSYLKCLGKRWMNDYKIDLDRFFEKL